MSTDIYLMYEGRTYILLHLVQTLDPANNMSRVHWTLIPLSNTVKATVQIKIDNDIKYQGRDLTSHSNQYGSTELASGDFYFYHNEDGTKSITVNVIANISTVDKGEITCRETSTISLSSIIKAVKIDSAADINLGANCNVSWNHKSSSATYKLRFAIGNWSIETDYIKPQSLGTYNYTGTNIPIAGVANCITKATSGTMTVYLSTYDGITQIGATDSKTFTVTVPASCKPNITKDSFNVYLDNSVNQVVSKWGVYVAGYSKARLTASATGQYGASISKYRITGGYGGANGIDVSTSDNSLNYTGGTLTTSGQITFTIRAVDTRGMESDAVSSKAVTVHSSGNPTISTFTARRKEDDEEYAIVFADWACSSIDGHNTATGKLQYKNAKDNNNRWQDCTDAITDGVSVDLSPAFSKDSAYNIRLTVTDALGKQTSKEVLLQTPFVLMDFRSGGKGLGIGGIATSDRFEIMLDTCFYNCKVIIRDDQGKEQTLEDYIKQVVRSMQT